MAIFHILSNLTEEQLRNEIGEQTKLNLAQLDDENNLMTRMGCINHFPFFDHFSLVLNPDFINCCLGILY